MRSKRVEKIEAITDLHNLTILEYFKGVNKKALPVKARLTYRIFLTFYYSSISSIFFILNTYLFIFQICHRNKANNFII